jgi:hypothetical protein
LASKQSQSCLFLNEISAVILNDIANFPLTASVNFSDFKKNRVIHAKLLIRKCVFLNH